jgi:hypothetical protein
VSIELNQSESFVTTINAHPLNKGGRPKNSVNLHSKQPSGIAQRLRRAGVDWVVDLANALKANDLTRINIWMKLLPYLVVTQNHKRVKRFKGHASKAALMALDELEGK